MPAARARAMRALAAAVAGGLAIAPGRAAVRASLLALPGIGPWTVEYVAMRALRDPTPCPRATSSCATPSAASAARDAAPSAPSAWRPWRAYAAMHLWQPAVAASST